MKRPSNTGNNPINTKPDPKDRLKLAGQLLIDRLIKEGTIIAKQDASNIADQT